MTTEGSNMIILPAEFESLTIRRVYDEATETWSFSVIDIIQVLTQQPDYQGARKYWKVLKWRLARRWRRQSGGASAR